VAGDNSRGIVSGDAPTLAKSILARDEHDQTRKIAPLVAAHTALIVDASHMNLHEVVSFLLQKMGK
jgi:cytidylate kinase